MGIHRPKSIYEADSARKRFIFDEFFYLQVILITKIVCVCSIVFYIVILVYFDGDSRLDRN